MEINGKPVVDARKHAVIHITDRDTIKGATKDPGACAAALAARRDIADCISARVHIGRVYIEQKEKWVRYQTPESLRTEIIAFDKGGSFQPGDYTLRPPAPSAREGRSGSETNRHGFDNQKKRPRKKLLVAKIKRHEVTGIRPSGANR